MNLYRVAARPLLFRLEAERAHELTLRAGNWAGGLAPLRAGLRATYRFDSPRLHTRIGGIDFPNPIGLPGGFDKNGVALAAAAAIGFGAIEVGSVSLNPSKGNPERPRLFRVPADEAVMVYYGVPNDGANTVAARVAAARRMSLGIPIGVSLVETNTGVAEPADAVIAEFAGAARVLAPQADYIVLNLNCPNSLGGVSVFDDVAHLRALFVALAEVPALPPVFMKSNVPTDPAPIDAILAAADGFDFVRGFIPGARWHRPLADLKTPPEVLAAMPGTLSGPFRRDLSRECVRRWYARIDRSRHVLIGVGGIRSALDAYAMIRAGASLVQLLTALIYHGPSLVRDIKVGLAALLERDGFDSVGAAVGQDVGDREA